MALRGIPSGNRRGRPHDVVVYSSAIAGHSQDSPCADSPAGHARSTAPLEGANHRKSRIAYGWSGHPRRDRRYRSMAGGIATRWRLLRGRVNRQPVGAGGSRGDSAPYASGVPAALAVEGCGVDAARAGQSLPAREPGPGNPGRAWIGRDVHAQRLPGTEFACKGDHRDGSAGDAECVSSRRHRSSS